MKRLEKLNKLYGFRILSYDVIAFYRNLIFFTIFAKNNVCVLFENRLWRMEKLLTWFQFVYGSSILFMTSYNFFAEFDFCSISSTKGMLAIIYMDICCLNIVYYDVICHNSQLHVKFCHDVIVRIWFD